VLVRDVGSTNAFEAVRRKAAAGKMRPSIFVVQHDAALAARLNEPKSGYKLYVAVWFQQRCALR
jgi:hypothetical protein